MKRIPVIIFGAGGVGRALLRQVVAGREATANRNQLRFDVVGVLDSRSWLWRPAGLSDEQLKSVVKAKEEGRAIGEERPDNLAALDYLYASDQEGALVVDVTAADGMESTVDKALELSYGVVLANKKPLAGPWESARAYYGHSRLRYESTVGGGQPVIATLRYLLDTNDPVFRIEGQLSGTLGYICGRLDEGAPFSHALSEAKSKGYTEPDPREDLGGRDVMRKIMILGRMAGWPLQESDIEVEVLYDEALAGLTVDAFMEASQAMDPSFEERVGAAGALGQVLRYAAEVTAGKGSVGLKAIPAESPLAGLKYISFETALYNEEPLMVGGKGAGVEMTAAGVLGDMIALAREGRGDAERG
jgi:homoserine dehydrogenase